MEGIRRAFTLPPTRNWTPIAPDKAVIKMEVSEAAIDRPADLVVFLQLIQSMAGLLR